MPARQTKRERQLQALHEVAVAAGGMLDPAQLAHLVVERARDLLDASEATLLWWDPAADGLNVLGDTYKRPFSRVLKAGEGAAGLAFQSGEPVIVEDYQAWEHMLKDSVPRGVKSVVAMPLLVRTRPLGVLAVSFDSTHAFAPDEIRLLSLFATQTAPAIEAARLHDQVVHMTVELRRATEAKSRFLASISHELRTPLNAIIGFSELLLESPQGAFDAARQQQFIEQIHTGGKQLLTMINDLLDLAKVEAGKMEISPADFDLRELIASAIEYVRPLAARKSIELGVEPGGPGHLHADPARVRQMLWNLLSNAIKFTPPAGKVSVSIRELPGEIAITVADTGVGISADDQRRLFEEFQQVGSSPAGHEGTGLGLSLVRRLAELHGGRVWVESTPGAGSRFSIAFPSNTAVVSGANAGEKPLVMVVEDNPSAALLLTTTLETAGYRVEVVRSGEGVLERAMAARPAAITLDVMLPDIDGWDVLHRLKGSPVTHDIPVVVISVLDGRAGLALGADDYLLKPFRRDALLAFLARHGLEPQQGRRATVLAVDDDPAALQLIKEGLEPKYEVITAPGGREALAVARSARPDAVILDLMMPGMNGFELAAALKADETTSRTPILVSTAQVLTAADKERLNGNATAVVRKGDSGAALLAWLAGQHLHGAQHRAS